METTSFEAKTPVMKQYAQLKAECGDALLFFRMGDFYELFGPDAEIAAPLLGVVLTARDKKSGRPIPMAGIPFHASQNYIQKCLNAGHKVAVAEQMQDPAQVKGLVERKIVRTLTPAIQFEESSPQERYLATLAVQQEPKNSLYRWITLEMSTGDFSVSEPLNLTHLFHDTLVAHIAHFIVTDSNTPPQVVDQLMDGYVNQGTSIHNGHKTLVERSPLPKPSLSEAKRILCHQWDILESGLPDFSPEILISAGALLKYVYGTQNRERLNHIKLLRYRASKNRMVLSAQTLSHLDFEDLITTLPEPSTRMGYRALRSALSSPFSEAQAIRSVQEHVVALSAERSQITGTKIKLKSVYDLDRLNSRVSVGVASPRDLRALAESVNTLFDTLQPWLQQTQTPCAESLRLQDVWKKCSEHLLSDTQAILKEFREDAPPHARDGNIFCKGLDAELDRWIDLSENAEQKMIEFEAQEREQTGIASLKVKYNRVFGYFIEVSSAGSQKVPEHYIRRQTMTGAERFTTTELKKFEDDILQAQSKRRAFEAERFKSWLNRAQEKSSVIAVLSESIGIFDSRLSFAECLNRPAWCMPEINTGTSLGDLHIENGRHPVVESKLKSGFIPNSIHLSDQVRSLIITGPNMGGKSTYMRQVALIIILAQSGAPIPATYARLALIDAIHTRIGAQDAIGRGQSTFMVEMVELASILNHATPRSLVILDEVGRGTSTYDGLSVAQSALEYLHEKTRCRLLFATHYHELTQLESQTTGLKNVHVSAQESGQNLRFLFEIQPGRAEKSFGVQVARLAGVPKTVIERAKKLLSGFESSGAASPQMDLFSAPITESEDSEKLPPAGVALLEEIQAIDPDALTPREALQKLYEIKSRAMTALGS